ncbi:MAG: cysteine desulfurase family protein [Chitinophagales bacterium]
MKPYNTPVYLDYNATTPVDKRVLEKMYPYFSGKFGNAASKTHAYGWVADAAVEKARKQIAALLNADASEISFTSGSTEGINLILRGVAGLYQSKGKHIITCATEHKAVLDTCADLEKQGFEITYLPVDKNGLIDLKTLENAIRTDTILIAIMWANNETGVIQDMKAIAEMAHRHKVILFSDATQAAGKIKMDIQETKVDALCLSAHKFYGPKGVGAIYLRRRDPRVKLQAQITGGGHEKGLRSGTLNVPGIVGMGEAAKWAAKEYKDRNLYWGNLSAFFLENLSRKLKGWHVNGDFEKRINNTLNLRFEGIKSERLIKLLAKDLACSTGSACTSAIMQPSHVLTAMGLSDTEADASLRLSMGKDTTQEEMEFVLEVLSRAVEKLRAL